MNVVINLLFWIHLVGLALGGAAAFGIPVVGSRMPTASAEARPVLFSIADMLSKVGRVAIGLLIVTGPLIAWLKFGGFGGFTAWFWIKMVLVVLLLVGVIYAGINGKRAERGDMAAAQRAPMIGAATAGTFILIILSAVFAFN
jgi:protoporphyrinogen IX oxidase